MIVEDRPITAIPTHYKGTLFKSRMEAQCACLFDKLGWKWEYEPFSLMLPSGLTYTPDFYVRRRTIVECRGYVSERGDRQIDEFAEAVEHPGGWPIPNADRMAHDYVVIGPSNVSVFTAGGYEKCFGSREEYEEVAAARKKATTRDESETFPGLIGYCLCGWRLQSQLREMFCYSCATRATLPAMISVNQGRVFLNGIAVEAL